MYHRSKTAFKHPRCGGVIFSYVWPEKTRFKCERCGKWADDLMDLALEQITQQPVPPVADVAADPDNHKKSRLTTGEKSSTKY
jgi:hypothetical protein